MDIPGSKPVAAVVAVLQSTTDESSRTATGAVTPAAVMPVATAAGTPGVSDAAQSDIRSHAVAIAAQLQDFLQSSRRDIEFRVDADTGTQVITVRDANTGDVIRQMPSEEVLRVLKSLNAPRGTLLDQLA
jgi:flagellar protein FlaG